MINRIAEINDESFLYALKSIIDSKAKSKFYKLTDEQLHEVKESKLQVKKGFFMSNPRWIKNLKNGKTKNKFQIILISQS